MTIIQVFSKKKMSDITIFEDDIDKEYRHRVFHMSSFDDLKSILIDYEEFLPSGIQSLREMDTSQSLDFLNRVNRIIDSVKKTGAMPGYPDEAVVIISPIVLSKVRVMAIHISHQRGKYCTWGEAFREIQANGMLVKMMQSQEGMYNHTIKVKKEASEIFAPNQ